MFVKAKLSSKGFLLSIWSPVLSDRDQRGSHSAVSTHATTLSSEGKTAETGTDTVPSLAAFVYFQQACLPRREVCPRR